MSFWNWIFSLFKPAVRKPEGLLALPPGSSQPIEGPKTFWEVFDGGLSRIPTGARERVEFFGDPKLQQKSDGTYIVDREWERENLFVARNLPCGVRKLYVHRKMEPYLREGLRRAVIAAPGYTVKRIGCFNPRPQRHDIHRPPSDHTWAIAVDINADQNRAFYYSDYDNAPKPFEDGWDKFSDIPQAWVEAMESVGWVWGGRWANFCDPMHFQLRRLRRD